MMIPKLKFESSNFLLLAGPCAIEGEQMAMEIAERIVKISNKLQIPYIFKGSYRKANRSRLDSFAGIGDEKALKILRKISETFDIPTVTVPLPQSEQGARHGAIGGDNMAHPPVHSDVGVGNRQIDIRAGEGRHGGGKTGGRATRPARQ